VRDGGARKRARGDALPAWFGAAAAAIAARNLAFTTTLLDGGAVLVSVTGTLKRAATRCPKCERVHRRGLASAWAVVWPDGITWGCFKHAAVRD